MTHSTERSPSSPPQVYSVEAAAPLNWNSLVAAIALQIRQSLDLATILQVAVDEVQQLLDCDRVLIYQFDPDYSGRVVVEAIAAPQWSLLDQVVHDSCFEACWLQPYNEGLVRAIADVTTANLTPCHADFLAGFSVKANLVVPVLCESRLWGLLIAHSCTAPHPWLTEEIEGLQHIAVHVGIAIHQAELVAQLRLAKDNFEAQVAGRTQALEQANQQLAAQVAENQAMMEALHQSRNDQFRLAAIVASSEEAIIGKTPDGVITSWNQAAERLFGYRAAEVVGQPVTLLIPSERQAEAEAILQRIHRGEQVETYETQRLHKDGYLVDVALTISPIRDETGRVIGASKIARDIREQQVARRDRDRLESERQQAVLELRQSNDQLEDFFDNASDLIQSVSLQDGRFLYVNRTWLTTLGYERDDLATLTIFDLLASDCLPQCQSIFQSLQAGTVHQLERLEVTLVSKTGQHILLEGSINVRCEAGTPVATRAIFRDITAQRQAEQALQEQTTLLRIFYETSPLLLGIVELSEDDILHTLHNPTTLQFLGIEAADLDNQWASAIGIPPDHIQLWLRHYRQSQAQRQPVQFEYEHVTAIGTYWLVAVVTYLGTASSGRAQFSYQVKDISDRKQLEAEHLRIEAMQRQTKRVSYELKLLETILDIILAGYWDWDIAGNQEYLSPGFKRMFGYADHELENSPDIWQQLIFPEDLVTVLACFEHHVQSHGDIPYYNEVRYRHKDGSTVWVACSGQVIEWAADGSPVRMIGCHINITKRKQAESALQTSEARWQFALEGSGDGVWDWDIQTKQLFVTHQWKAMLGYADAEIGSSLDMWDSRIHPDDKAQCYADIERHFNGETDICQIEYRMRCKDGSYKWILDRGKVIEWAIDGKPLRMIGTHTDISDRKQAELDLKSANDQLQLVLQASSEGFWDWDLITGEIYFSPQWKAMLGYADHELENSPEMWKSLIFEDDLTTALQLIDDYNSGRAQGFTATQRFHHKDGSVVHILSRAIHLNDEQGMAVRMVGSHLDITQTVTVQTALQTSEMQLSGILNSSLDGIMAFRSVRDGQGTIVDFEWLLSNPTSCQIIGRQVGDIIGKRLLEELPGNREDGLFDLYVQVVESGEPLQRQFYYNHDGIDCWFENIAVKLGDGFAVTFRDITAIKQSEMTLQQTNQQLSDRISELDQRHSEMLVLSEISDFLQACSTVEEACHTIINLVEPLFPHCSGGIFTTSASRNRLEQVAAWGSHCHSSSDFEPHNCWGLRRGRMHWVEQNRLSLRCSHIPADEAIAATLCIPMMAQGETLGLLYLSTETPEALPEAKQQLARTLAEQVGMAIANLRLQETLKHQSIRDPLTGLYNRRYLEEFLNREIAHAQRKQHSIGVIMIDIDHFKRFNDTYGHDMGDAVLKLVGVLLKDNVRDSDIACRYGGEEMTLILPEAGLAETAARAETIRVAITQLRLSQNSQLIDSITASLGVACFPQHGSTSSSLTKMADAALYRAKEAGRNQVLMAL
ncbi:MAG TPA: PAS domain S-box protein [Candidatus Obscuribacterales bacterium]